ELVAVEKSGIIKGGIPVVIGETLTETKQVFEKITSERNAPITFAEIIDSTGYVSDLKGNYQQKNIKTVLATLRALQKKGLKISEEDIKTGLLKTIKNTGLMGRWQLLKESPKVLCDTAHNKDGLQLVMEQLAKE